MKLIFYILKNNKKLKLDNEQISLLGIKRKLREEYRELIKITSKFEEDNELDSLKDVAREAMDVIQVCILYMYKINKLAKEKGSNNLIEEINKAHNNKLIIERRWVPETSISVEIKK